MAEVFNQATAAAVQFHLDVLTWRLGAAFGLGCLVAGIYWLTNRRAGPVSRSFLATLILLSVVIALVTVVIGDNIARAFSLVGALAIVRFRTVVEDTRDTAFVMFAVVVGMAAGADYIVAPLLAAPLVLVAAWVFRPTRPPTEPAPAALVLRLAAVNPPDERIHQVLRKHGVVAHLTSLGTARGGTALDMTFAIRLPDPHKTLALVAELSAIEGVQNVEVKG